jgi:drug/metabolite transporter (DMT)-like permease
MTEVRRSASATYARLTLMALCWGGTFIGGRVATAEMAPAAAALWRYALASVALLVVAFVIERGLPRLDARQWTGVVLLAITGVVMFNLFFMYGLARVPASRGSLIMALNPAVTLLGAALFLRERLTRRKVYGIALALFGVVIVLGHGNPLNLFRGSVGIGELVLFGCPVSWAANTLIAKRMLPDLSAIAATTWSALIGTVVFALIVAFGGNLAWPHVSVRTWSAIVFLGIFGTAVALVLFYGGVRAIGPARTSVFINLVPVFAVALGVLLLGEPLEFAMVAGGALVIAGIFLLNRPEPAQARLAAAA